MKILLPELFESQGGIVDGFDSIAVVREKIFKILTDVLVIVDNKDTQLSHGRPSLQIPPQPPGSSDGRKDCVFSHRNVSRGERI